MSTRQRPAERGRLKGIAAAQRFTNEIREARLNHALSQADAAREAGITRSTWTRIERGDQTSLTLEQAGRMAGAVGLDFVVQLYPSSAILRDEGHVRLLSEFRTLLGPDWTWRYEVPLGPAPEQRSWDMVGTHRITGLVIRVEGETRLRDCQATVRRLASKRLGDPPSAGRGRPRESTQSGRGPNGSRHHRSGVRDRVGTHPQSPAVGRRSRTRRTDVRRLDGRGRNPRRLRPHHAPAVALPGHAAATRDDPQQMRGSCSPMSMSTMRSEPMSVFIVTIPG